VKQLKISFAGAGKVAHALSRELYRKGHVIEHIVSRNIKNASALASLYGGTFSDKLDFPSASDLIIIAVPDHALPDVLDKIKAENSVLIAHTAGSLGLEVFPAHIKRKGIFYPLQTFTVNREPDISDVPFFLEASDENSLELLNILAGSISDKVYVTDSGHRRQIHLAAVFVSNFTNYMITSGKLIASKADLPFDVLHPLILETINKALELGPEVSQTGPAVRYDLNTIEKHLDLLSFSPDLKDIYEVISGSIMKYYKQK
jgi:predicted short-subunit dehydrogenase-like oxidoreductase (DUF2520 family)